MLDPTLAVAILAVIATFVFLGLWLSERARSARAAAQVGAQAAAATLQRSGETSDVEARVKALTDKIVEGQREIIITLTELVEFRNRESETHVERVAEFARIFADILGLDPEEALLLTEAAPMHDIGKIGLPDYILNKTGSLSTEELAIMQNHTRLGHDILARHHGPLFQRAAQIALEHHERWDGTGYPQGLRGEGISLFARIVGLCDVFDSLTNPRPYKDAWPIDRTMQFLADGAGHHFDPRLVARMTENTERFLKIVVRMRDR